MNRNLILFLAVFIPSAGLILMGGCSKTFGPVVPTYIPNTSTPTGSPTPTGPWGSPVVTGSPTPLYTTGTALPSITHTPTNSPTNSPTNTPTSVATIAYTSGTAIPSITRTPTNSPTNSPTNTPTSDPTPVVTACQTYAGWGEKTLGANSVTLSSGTVLQSYSFPQSGRWLNAVVSCNYASAGASIQMGLYADGGGFPTTLIYEDSPQPAYPFSNWIAGIPYGGFQLNAGTYWLAFSVVSGSVGVDQSSGSTTKMTTVTGTMPYSINMAAANPDPPAATGQYYMGGYFDTCTTGAASPIPTLPPSGTPTNTPTLTGSPTPVPTLQPSSTPTSSPTGSPTSNPSPCPTGVPASLNLSSKTLSSTTASAGTTFVGFVLDASQNAGAIYNQIVRVQYQAQATGNLSSQIQAAQLWLDNDGNGVIGPGDALLQRGDRGLPPPY